MVRLGHPARLQANILPYSLEALVQSSEETALVRDVRMELQSYLRILSNPKSRASDKRVAYGEVKTLRKGLRQREWRAVQSILESSQVVLATCVGTANAILKRNYSQANGTDCSGFDLVIVDEAAQALEAACWIPALQCSRKLVLAGDHWQLPPTIKCSNPAVQKGLGQTMFERLMTIYEDLVW